MRAATAQASAENWVALSRRERVVKAARLRGRQIEQSIFSMRQRGVAWDCGVNARDCGVNPTEKRQLVTSKVVLCSRMGR